MADININYKQIEKSILDKINLLDRNKTPKFLDTLESYHIDLYNIRIIIIKDEYKKLPTNGSFKSIIEHYNCAIQYYNYYYNYNMMMISHPIFYDLGKLTEKNKIRKEIHIINDKLKLIIEEIQHLEKHMK